jgi:hypothetical protein
MMQKLKAVKELVRAGELDPGEIEKQKEAIKAKFEYFKQKDLSKNEIDPTDDSLTEDNDVKDEAVKEELVVKAKPRKRVGPKNPGSRKFSKFLWSSKEKENLFTLVELYGKDY